MHCHANARLTPRGRAEVFAVIEAGMTVLDEGEELGIVSPSSGTWTSRRPRRSTRTSLARCSAGPPSGWTQPSSVAQRPPAGSWLG
jgi:hypothetical protein